MTISDNERRWWDFNEDGERLEGVYVEAGKGRTANGDRLFLVLLVDGKERTRGFTTPRLRAASGEPMRRSRSRPASGSWSSAGASVSQDRGACIRTIG